MANTFKELKEQENRYFYGKIYPVNDKRLENIIQYNKKRIAIDINGFKILSRKIWNQDVNIMVINTPKMIGFYNENNEFINFVTKIEMPDMEYIVSDTELEMLKTSEKDILEMAAILHTDKLPVNGQDSIVVSLKRGKSIVDTYIRKKERTKRFQLLKMFLGNNADSNYIEITMEPYKLYIEDKDKIILKENIAEELYRELHTKFSYTVNGVCTTKEFFPDWNKIKTGTWSKYSFSIPLTSYMEKKEKFIHVGLHRKGIFHYEGEPTEKKEIMVNVNIDDKNIFCEPMEVKDNETENEKSS